LHLSTPLRNVLCPPHSPPPPPSITAPRLENADPRRIRPPAKRSITPPLSQQAIHTSHFPPPTVGTCSRTSASPFKQPQALDCCQNYSSLCARSAPASPPHMPPSRWDDR
jgi:hypothetical protein